MTVRVLLVGSSGFFGTHLKKVLIGGGFEVLELAERIVPGQQRANLNQLVSLGQVDVVLNLASGGIGSTQSFSSDGLWANSELPLYLAELMEKARIGCSRYIHFATALEASGPPFESTYVTTKALGTNSLRTHRESLSFDTTILWISNTYGPLQPLGRFVSQAIHELRRGSDFYVAFPERSRNFCFVSDVAEAVINVLGSNQETDYWFTSLQSTPIVKVAMTIKNLLPGTEGSVVFERRNEHDQWCTAPQIPKDWTVGRPLSVISCATSLEDGLNRQIGGL